MPRYDLMHWSQRVRDQQAASEQKVSVPPQLWHGVLFYTAGERKASCRSKMNVACSVLYSSTIRPHSMSCLECPRCCFRMGGR